MLKEKIDTAFILAAGKGTRLRPYTDTLPKPMVKLGDRPIIEHIIQKLDNHGISKTVINLFYLGDIIRKNIIGTKTQKIIFSEENIVLETGGGVKKALPLLDQNPFFLINGDAFWIEGDNGTALQRLENSWDSDKMDILMLLQPVTKMKLTQGVGDYNIDIHGQATRTPDGSGAYMFTGVRISKPNLFEKTPDGAFSYLEIMDRAEKNQTLYGIVHEGEWHHISTPDDLKSVNSYLKSIHYDQ
ncbi:MAG: nucleotidyltransferase family protein [Alphaproteobacteria bacterium]|nr:nucleotidyltransferase family protein [Alphaproteobacteria bacterium]NCQ88555.1 nucleotidyltransferase family protein [Alphaproteobacteria bacterium]NCT06098.1 nucleotidyltransferase family protein [Alphaproteobacteria bacterium]